MLVAVLGGIARNPHDDSAAPSAYRQGTRHPQVSRGPRLFARPWLKAGSNPEESRHGFRPRRRRKCAPPRAAGLGQSPGAKIIFGGFFIGLIYKALNVAFKLWRTCPRKSSALPLKAGSVSMEISPELIGVGYIIGPRIARSPPPAASSLISSFIPLIKFFGDGIEGAVAPGAIPISKMARTKIRGAYVLYIGAGAVAAGGIISLLARVAHDLAWRPDGAA